ncbi:hypothetical protein [Microvirga mediterraneensis]|uniref:Uncharacterized protein n=1 Tax=Microvirga mediterraneensis TaxID=2754695 RepID=A0A838BME1_9HYPH|nr:hypothetical protein [Microvirga mediterraneensis]MBA1156610.1 hypothetical protein [Microvirga mediterraneensis]
MRGITSLLCSAAFFGRETDPLHRKMLQAAGTLFNYPGRCQKAMPGNNRLRSGFLPQPFYIIALTMRNIRFIPTMGQEE